MRRILGEAQVLPKSAHVQLVDEAGRAVGSVVQIRWPASVESVDGQWIRVRDSGGYSVPPVVGWVRKDEMLRFGGGDDQVPRTEDPRSYYTDTLEESPAPSDAGELHWLRGIYYESQGETDAAILDYCAAAGPALPESCRATCRSCTQQASSPRARTSLPLDSPASFAVADACLRLGGMLAQKESQDDSIKDDDWKFAFGAAKSVFNSLAPGRPNSAPPQLHFAWGSAAYQRYKAALSLADSLNPDEGSIDASPPQGGVRAPVDYRVLAKCYRKVAERKFQDATDPKTGNPIWSDPLFSLGELYLMQARDELRIRGKQSAREKPRRTSVRLRMIRPRTLSPRLLQSSIMPFKWSHGETTHTAKEPQRFTTRQRPWKRTSRIKSNPPGRILLRIRTIAPRPGHIWMAVRSHRPSQPLDRPQPVDRRPRRLDCRSRRLECCP